MDTIMKRLSPKLFDSAPLSFLCLFITSGILIVGAGLAAVNRELWYDEFFTFYIAQLSSHFDILTALLEKVDINPPLDHFFRHFSMKWWGDTPLAFRMPSLLLFLLGSFFLYRFVSFRISPLPALAAFCFPILTIALRYSHEGRPYALLYAASALSLFAWQKSVEHRHKSAYLLILFLALTAGCYSHFFGTFSYLPIAIGETIRLWRARKIEFRIFSTLLVSSLTIIPLYPLIVNAAQSSHHFWTPLDRMALFRCYENLLPHIGYSITAVIVLVIPLACYLAGTQSREVSHPGEEIPLHELAAAVVLCLIPIFLYIAAITVTKAFTDRYAIVAVNGFSILVAYACHRLGRANSILAVIMIACILFLACSRLAKTAQIYSKTGGHVNKALISLIETSTLPVVFSNPKSFLRHNYYLPENLTGRITYLIDEKESIHYLGNNTDEIALPNLRKIKPLRLISYKTFHEMHGEYYVVTRDLNDGWLIRRIRDDFKQHLVDIGIVFLSPNFKVVKVQY
jgi:hypothetical protein